MARLSADHFGSDLRVAGLDEYPSRRRVFLAHDGSEPSRTQLLDRFRDYTGGFAAALAGWDAIRQAAGPAVDAMLAEGVQPG